MIRAKVLPELLGQVLTDEITASILITAEGAVLGCAGSFYPKGNEKFIAAIVSDAWEGYKAVGGKVSPMQHLEYQLLECDEGWIGSAPAGPDYLICALIEDSGRAPLAQMKKKLMAMGKHVAKLLAETSNNNTTPTDS